MFRVGLAGSSQPGFSAPPGLHLEIWGHPMVWGATDIESLQVRDAEHLAGSETVLNDKELSCPEYQ